MSDFLDPIDEAVAKLTKEQKRSDASEQNPEPVTPSLPELPPQFKEKYGVGTFEELEQILSSQPATQTPEQDIFEEDALISELQNSKVEFTDDEISEYLKSKGADEAEIAELKSQREKDDFSVLLENVKKGGIEATEETEVLLKTFFGLNDDSTEDEKKLGAAILKSAANTIRSENLKKWNEAAFEFEDNKYNEINSKLKDLATKKAQKVAQKSFEKNHFPQVEKTLSELGDSFEFNLGKDNRDNELGVVKVLIKDETKNRIKEIMKNPAKFSEKYIDKNADTQQQSINYDKLRDLIVQNELFKATVKESYLKGKTDGFKSRSEGMQTYPSPAYKLPVSADTIASAEELKRARENMSSI